MSIFGKIIHWQIRILSALHNWKVILVYLLNREITVPFILLRKFCQQITSFVDPGVEGAFEAAVKSLVIHPATTTHSQCTEEELLDQGIKPNTIRLSIGIEKAEDLIAALDAAFEAVDR